MIKPDLNISCPIPISEYDCVVMAHGGGGRMSDNLIKKMFFSQLGNEYLDKAHDGAILPLKGNRLAFTTDSYVVNPVFFPGGNIGELAVNGTVNDLVCCGAKPLYISLAFIIEEGFLMNDLWRIVLSISLAAKEAGVKIVTGDTKVVEKGKGDKIYINTSGVGEIAPGIEISPERCSPGDIIILNGTVADHGIAILSKRQNLSFESGIVSDTASLSGMMADVFENCRDVHVLRDPTRGGLASSLNEIASSAGVGITIYEDSIPLNESVKGACELMGFDPLYVANEGKILVFVPGDEAEKVLAIMKRHPEGKESSVIGEVTGNDKGLVKLKTLVGSTRIVDMISGEQLPRIC
ncbi:MAG TPA: hydrogenase expression/formation protein HypE [Bacteroidales bacterium]|nr:hydrogenase expression/formation protein HypE [Bacteroidales bacterium]